MSCCMMFQVWYFLITKPCLILIHIFVLEVFWLFLGCLGVLFNNLWVLPVTGMFIYQIHSVNMSLLVAPQLI